MSEETKIPSPVRLNRVEETLAKDPQFKSLVKPKTVEVEGRGGAKAKYSQAVVDIAVALTNADKDAATCKRSDILAMASATPSAAAATPASTAAVADNDGETLPPPAPEEPTAPESIEETIASNNHFIAISSMLLSIRALLAFDKQEGHEARKAAVDKLSSAVKPFVRPS